MNRFAVTLDSVVIVSRQNQISDGDPKKRVCLKFVFVKNNEKNRGIHKNIGSITNFVGFPIPLVALSAHIE